MEMTTELRVGSGNGEKEADSRDIKMEKSRGLEVKVL